MAALPVEILLGVYLGLLTGIIPAIVGFGLGFIFKYFTGVTVPALAVVVLAVAIAGVSGGLLALADPSITTGPNPERVIVAILVVMMMALYAHSQGDALGASLPHRLSIRGLRNRTLSADVVDLVGGRGQVRVTVIGEVADLEGYPPLPADLREEIAAQDWTFPADVPVSELETRVSDALRTDFDLTGVSVRIDDQGRASVAAAPPSSGLSKRVTSGRRAVSIDALVPTGLARGDDVSVVTDGRTITGTVVSARSDQGDGQATKPASDGGTAGPPPTTAEPAAPTTTGGEGRLTVAVSREDARALLDVNRAHVVVRARGTRREFELLSLLRRTGKRVRRFTLRPGSQLDGTTIGEAAIRETHGVGVLAVRDPTGWTIAPRGSTRLVGGTELYVVGPSEGLTGFEGVVS